MDYEPLSVALEFGFLALLFLFLLWIARSSRRDLRRLAAGPAPDSTGIHSTPSGRTPTMRDAWLVIETGGGLEPGERFDLFGGVSIGRSSEADIRIDDRYASGIHVRVFDQQGRFYVEDMQSTNGTLLNGRPLEDEEVLGQGDRLTIGDTVLVFEEG